MSKKKQKDINYPVLSQGCQLVDTHCHLDMEPYSPDLAEVIERSRLKGVEKIVTIGIDLESSQKAISLAEQHPGIYATVGIHPHNVTDLEDSIYEDLAMLADHPKVVGFGEIGMDLYYDHAPEDRQRQHFDRQVELAKKLALPLVVHDRDAHSQVLAILREQHPFPAGGVMHCFSGDNRFAREILELGLLISITGVVTFRKSTILQEVVREVPLDRLILETDGPYLTPEPRRGRRNESSLLLFTAARVAELKGLSLDEVAGATTLNAEKLFGLSRKA
jgi:TatD DNase family protein